MKKIIKLFLYTMSAVFFLASLSYSNEISGENLFNRNCAACHKKTAPNLLGTTLDYNVFKSIVLNGRSGTMMGSFKSKFSEHEVKSIYSFLRAK